MVAFFVSYSASMRAGLCRSILTSDKIFPYAESAGVEEEGNVLYSVCLNYSKLYKEDV